MTPDTTATLTKRPAPAGTTVLPWGAMIYAISFFLPAVAESAGHNGVRGWWCAWFTLCLLRERPLFFAAGLVNPLTVAYLALRVTRKAAGIRRALAIATLSLIPVSWIVIADGLSIRIGHVAWVSGLILILGPEALGIADSA